MTTSTDTAATGRARRRGWLAAALAGVVVAVLAIVVARRAQAGHERRGEELARAYGCVGCHSPPGGAPLSGYVVGAWLAPNVSPDPVSGIGGWSRAEVFRYLRQGRAPGRAQAAGPMAPIVGALGDRPDDDLYALVDWLARQPAHRDTADRVAAAARGEPLRVDPAVLRGASLARAPDATARGATLYNSSCASCHGADGSGTPDGYYPSLFHNSAVGRRIPYNLLAVLLFGVERRVRSEQVMMPSFDGRQGAYGGLPDDELAALASFVVRQFGNPAAAMITTRDIETARSGSWLAGGTTAARGRVLAVGGGPRAAGGAGTACFRCHGFEGEGDAVAGYPRLAGLDARYLVKQMLDYRSGARPNTAMSAIARQLDPADYQGVALYYAESPTGPPRVRTTAADSALVQRGATLYARGSADRGIMACAGCHGADGRGSNRTFPSIVQPASYTDAQLRSWRAGVRRNDIGDVMGRLSRPMTDDDVRALSAYVAGLTP